MTKIQNIRQRIGKLVKEAQEFGEGQSPYAPGVGGTLALGGAAWNLFGPGGLLRGGPRGSITGNNILMHPKYGIVRGLFPSEASNWSRYLSREPLRSSGVFVDGDPINFEGLAADALVANRIRNSSPGARGTWHTLIEKALKKPHPRILDSLFSNLIARNRAQALRHDPNFVARQDLADALLGNVLHGRLSALTQKQRESLGGEELERAYAKLTDTYDPARLGNHAAAIDALRRFGSANSIEAMRNYGIDAARARAVDNLLNDTDVNTAVSRTRRRVFRPENGVVTPLVDSTGRSNTIPPTVGRTRTLSRGEKNRALRGGTTASTVPVDIPTLNRNRGTIPDAVDLPTGFADLPRLRGRNLLWSLPMILGGTGAAIYGKARGHGRVTHNKPSQPNKTKKEKTDD